MNSSTFKIQDNGQIINKTVYHYVSLKQNDIKEFCWHWDWQIGKTEPRYKKGNYS